MRRKPNASVQMVRSDEAVIDASALVTAAAAVAMIMARTLAIRVVSVGTLNLLAAKEVALVYVVVDGPRSA